MHTVILTKEATIWSHMTKYARGGSGGSSVRGTKNEALTRALCNVRNGESYKLIVNGRDEGTHTK